jgi:hypothetical protein
VANNSALLAKVTQTSYPLGTLELGKTYYWKVNEVNNVASQQLWESDIWSFSTIGYLTVETFEDYNNSSPKRIFQTWVDGVGYSADQYFPVAYNGNGSNAMVGHDIWTPGTTYTNIMERTIIHGGVQSMPMDYNDAKPPYYSETERTWAAPQDWTTLNVKALTLWFRGYLPSGTFKEGPTGSFTVAAAGTDIWNNTRAGDAAGYHDEFRYAYKTLSGDGSIQLRVDSIENTNAWAKGGVMIRDTLDSHSPYAMVVVTPGQGVAFQYRTTAGGGSTNVQQAGITAPRWIKITRAGSTITGEHSVDGITWTAVGAGSSITITMNAVVYIGMALTSHNADALCHAVFSNVVTSDSTTGQWQSQDIGMASNTVEPLYVAVGDSTGKKSPVITNTDPNAVLQSVWQEWNISLSQFTGVNLKGITKMYIGTGNRTSPKAGGSGSLYFDDIRLYPSRCLPAILKPAADVNSDCVVDYLDLDTMANQWLMSAPPALSTDFNTDSKVDLKDFAKLAQGWLEEKLWP